MHCLWEIIDNAVDEALAGFCTRVDVTLHADGSAEVHDNGRGIPVDKEPKTGLSGVEVVYTKLHAGGKFGGGLVRRDRWSARRRRLGRQRAVARGSTSRSTARRRPSDVLPARRARACSPARARRRQFEPQSGLRKGGRVKKGVTGTRVRFWPDRQIFTRDATFAWDELVTRARQTSFIVPGLELDPRPTCAGGEPVTESFRHDGGITEFCELPRHDEPVTDVLPPAGFGLVHRDRAAARRPGPHDAHRTSSASSASTSRCAGGPATRPRLRSFVNVIATPKGGTHVAGFEAALTKTFNEAMRGSRVLKANDTDVIKDDVLEGLTAVVTVRLAEPQFEGQTKEVLGTPAARSVVRKVVAAELKGFLTSNKRAEKAQAKLVMEKVAGAAKTRLAARQHRDDPAPQERAGVLGAARQARRLPRPTTSTAPSCSSSRATRRSARPSWPATRSSRRCCRSAARSSTCRRPPWPTC